MKTLHEIYQKYAGADARSGCDKGTVHSYVEKYAELFSPYRTARRVLEVGIMGGHSLRMWEEFFAQAEVCGVDLCDRPFGGIADLRPMLAEGTHWIELFDATDLAAVNRHLGAAEFDVIIEDANHDLGSQLAIWENLKARLSQGGIYVIEDVENIDASKSAFEALAEPGISVDVVDLRALKGRFDDVLIVLRRI